MLHSVVIAETGFKGKTAPIVGAYEDTFRLAKEIGFDAVQLTVNRPEEQPAEKICKLCGQYGIAVSSIATGMGYSVDGLFLASPDTENRLAAVARMCGHVDLALRIGKPKVVIGAIRGFASEGMTEEQYVEALRDSCSRVLDYAVKKDVKVITEAMDYTETNVMLGVEPVAAFIRSFKTPYFGLQLDTMHNVYAKEDTVAAIKKHGDILAQVDLCGVARAVPADGGEVDYKAAIAALREVDYKDYLVYEFVGDPAGANAKAGLEYIRAL